MGSSAPFDDGWVLEPEPKPEDPLTKLVREALTILEGSAPDEINLSGDGWSLVDPDSVSETQPPAPERESRPVLVAVPEPVPEPTEAESSGSFEDMIRAALDEAYDDGWVLAEDEAPSELTEDEQAFFAAGEAMAESLDTVACEIGKYQEEPTFWQRLFRRSA